MLILTSLKHLEAKISNYSYHTPYVIIIIFFIIILFMLKKKMALMPVLCLMVRL